MSLSKIVPEVKVHSTRADTTQESIFEQNTAFCLNPEVNTRKEFCLTPHHNKEDKEAFCGKRKGERSSSLQTELKKKKKPIENELKSNIQQDSGILSELHSVLKKEDPEKFGDGSKALVMMIHASECTDKDCSNCTAMKKTMVDHVKRVSVKDSNGKMKEQLSVLIDGGSFGTVYLRADCSVVKEVKKVSNRLIMSHNLLKEFPLKHTVVPQITWNPFLYSMPYVASTLGSLQKQEGSFATKDVFVYVIRIAIAMEEIHSNGLVHMDIKRKLLISAHAPFCQADNIGVTQKRKSVKLIDVDTMCKEGDFVEPCGSKGYAAPEVIKAFEENKKIQADTSFDVFSFGKTIRNLLPNTESQNLLFQSLNSIVKLSTKENPVERPSIKNILEVLLTIYNRNNENLCSMLPTFTCPIYFDREEKCAKALRFVLGKIFKKEQRLKKKTQKNQRLLGYDIT